MTYGYARVSSEEESAEEQMLALRQAGCRRGSIYIDHVKPGTYADRPQLRKCLSQLKSGDLLIVLKLNRLARNMRDLVSTVTELQQRGVHLRSLTDKVDTSSTCTSALHLFKAFAQLDSGLRAERTTAGRAEARRQGRRFGRKPIMTPAQKAAALKLLAVGETTERIAADFGVSRSTLYRALRQVPRSHVVKPFRARKPTIPEIERLWQLVNATDPETIKVLEINLGKSQAEVVNYLIEETSLSSELPSWTGSRGTPEQRRSALSEANRLNKGRFVQPEPIYNASPDTR